MLSHYNMARQIVDKIHYTFDASAQTITFSATYTGLELGHIKIITNVVDNLMIYQFNDPSMGGSLAGLVLTLNFDTTAMSDTDDLQIFVEANFLDVTVPVDIISSAGDLSVHIQSQTAPLEVDIVSTIPLTVDTGIVQNEIGDVIPTGEGKGNILMALSATDGETVKPFYVTDSGEMQIIGTVLIEGFVPGISPLTDTELRATPVDVNVTGGITAGTEYTSGDVDATPTGTLMMVSDGVNILPAASNILGQLSINGIVEAVITNIEDIVSQKIMAESLPVVIASDQSPISVTETNPLVQYTTGDSEPVSQTGTVLMISDGATMNPISINNFLPVSIGSFGNVTGQAVMTNSFPVVIASDQSAIDVNVTGTVDIDSTGLASEAKQDILNATVHTRGDDLSNPVDQIGILMMAVDAGDEVVPISTGNGGINTLNNNGSGALAVNIQDGGNSITVDGTVSVTGVATEATLSTLNTKIPSNLTVTGGRLQVELPSGGGGLTDTQLRATPVPVSLASSPLPTGAATEATLDDLRDVVTSVKFTDGQNDINSGTGFMVMGIDASDNARPFRIDSSRLLVDATIASIPSHPVTNAGTFAVQAAQSGTWNIGSITTLPSLPAGTNNIGDVDVLSLPSIPAGNNNIGDVDVASIAAGTNYIGKTRLTDGTTDAEVVPLAGYNAQAVAIVDASGNQITSFSGSGVSNVVSTANSSSAVLGAGAVFTGTSEDLLNYGEIKISVLASHPSATDGLSIQQSSNGTNWDIVDNYTIPANSGKPISVPRQARYFRIVYTNGATLQTSFRLQTIFNAGGATKSSQRPSDAYSNEVDTEQVWSFNSLLNPDGSWDRWKSQNTGIGNARVTQYDGELGAPVGMTSLRDLTTAQRYTLWGDSLSDGIAAQWTQTTASGGTITSSAGEGLIQTSANATGSAQITGPTVDYFPGQVAWFNSAIRLGDTGSAGNIRRWGIFTVSGTTPQNGYYFELNGTTLNIVSATGGVATTVASTSWTKFTTAPFTLDTNYHGYEIRFTANSALFYIDNVLRHTVSGTTTPLTTTLNFPITVTSVNTSGATNRVIAVRNIGLGRFGTAPAAPHVIGYSTIHKDVEYTTAQTGTAIWTPPTGKKFVVTDVTIATGGTTAGVVTLWQGASGDTTYSVGTDPAIFKGEFAPSANSKPGFVKQWKVPYVSTTVDHILRITTSAAITIYVQVDGYEI